ncbi:MAG: hypothetical protein ACJAW3_000190 [Lentimonas sp.]|jgi:hypothetical protein
MAFLEDQIHQKSHFFEKIVKSEVESATQNHERSLFVDPNKKQRTQNSKIIFDHFKEKAIREASSVSEIAAKTGLTPNKLIEIYQSPENGEVDISSMSKDFNGGKGVLQIQERRKEFDQTGIIKQTKDEQSFVDKLGLNKESKLESFAQKVRNEESGTSQSISH